jgi:signal transduction histidine kinase
MTTSARRWAADTALAALVTGVDLLVSLTAGSWHGAHKNHPGPFGITLLIVSGAALMLRRRYPGTVLGIVLVTTLGASALGVQMPWLALITAFFNGIWRERRVVAYISLGIGYGVSVSRASLTYDLGLLAWMIALLAIAEVTRAWRQRAAADARGREEAMARRASEERLAIARDLHDVVAHSISVINVQANTALHLMDRRPERAREALTAIREVSGQALSELGSVLGALRDTGAPLAPTPGIARLDELAARARSAGLAVSVEASGEVRTLPAGVDAAAYRIVQEALTNAVRHSGGNAAIVRLRYGADSVEVEVDDDGTGTGPDSRDGTSGNGLAGMTERARALGGTLDAGPQPGGGFRVLARLPA